MQMGSAPLPSTAPVGDTEAVLCRDCPTQGAGASRSGWVTPAGRLRRGLAITIGRGSGRPEPASSLGLLPLPNKVRISNSFPGSIWLIALQSFSFSIFHPNSFHFSSVLCLLFPASPAVCLALGDREQRRGRYPQLTTRARSESAGARLLSFSVATEPQAGSRPPRAPPCLRRPRGLAHSDRCR